MILGVDISKNSLDIAYRSENGFQHKLYMHNNAKSAKKILTDFKHQDLHVVMEATGNYGLNLAQGFYELGIPVSMVNSLCIKRFGQMKLRRAKTDASDAQLIAEYAESQVLSNWQPKPMAQEALMQLTRSLDDLQLIRTEILNRQEAAAHLVFEEQTCKSIFQTLLETVMESIETLKKELACVLNSDYAEERGLLESIPGVGLMTIGTLIAHCGRFENFEKASQVVAYAGLNPSPYQSGTSVRGRGSISKRGHTGLRRVLFMGALSAAFHNPKCRALYLRLLEKGKPKRAAVVAVAHKLLRQAFGVLKGGQPFQANFVKT